MSERVQQVHARLVGFWYLAVMAAFVAPYVITSQMVAPGDYEQTARNVAASEALYRLALVIQIAGCAAIVLLGVVFHALLKPVNATLALLGAVWRTCEALLLAFAAVLRFAMLANYMRVADEGDASEAERLHHLLSGAVTAASYVAFIFLALGSVAFFIPLYRARYVPRALTAFAVLASIAMLSLGCAYLVMPARVDSIGLVGMAPMFVAEIALGLWLLIRGVHLRD